jgi:hypothetical protein
MRDRQSFFLLVNYPIVNILHVVYDLIANDFRVKLLNVGTFSQTLLLFFHIKEKLAALEYILRSCLQKRNIFVQNLKEKYHGIR